jgi:hypothetical protein
LGPVGVTSNHIFTTPPQASPSRPCRVGSDEFVGLGQIGRHMAENVLKKAHCLGAGGKLTAEWPEEASDKIVQVNLKRVWLCMKAELEQMVRQGPGFAGSRL